MLTVYLDQAKWIDLARAMHGRADGDHFRPAFDVAMHAVALGMAEFPLSNGHYIETWRQGDDSRRRRLAQTMIEVSRGRGIAKPPDLCDGELDLWIADITGRPVAGRQRPALGWGFGHISGTAQVGGASHVDLDLDLELERLAQRPRGFDGHGRGHRDFGDMYRDGEQRLSDERQSSVALNEAVLAGSAVMEIHENIEWALERAGLARNALGPIGLARPDLPVEQARVVLDHLLNVARGFIAGMPTRDAALRLRLARHQNPNSKWESNDMVDIAYLACAVVHCDLIVTEKQWVHELERSGLLALHNARAIHNTAALPETLIQLASK